MNNVRCEKDKDFETILAEVYIEAECTELKANKERKRKRVSALGGYLNILLLFAMLGLYCVISVLNFGYDLEAVFVETMIVTIGMMVITAFLSWLYSVCFSYEEYSLEGFLRFSLFLILVVYIDSHYLYHAIAEGIVSTECRWLYELLILPATAIVAIHLCKAVEKNNTYQSNISALMSLICWNITMAYLSSRLYMSYQSSLIITNAFIVGGVILTSKAEKKHYGNRIAMIIAYLGGMLLYSYLKKDGAISIWAGFQGYVDAVRRLFLNAKMLSPAYDGINGSLVALLEYNYNSLQSIIAYFGIVPATIYYVLLMSMMGVFGVTVYRIKEDRVFFSLGLAAYSHLLMRMLLGFAYAVAISPVRVELPFAGQNKIIDFCACSILLMNYFRYKTNAGYTGMFCEVKNRLFKKLVEIYELEDDDWEDVTDEEIC